MSAKASLPAAGASDRCDLRIRLLGPITADRGSAPLRLGGPKPMTVLAALLLGAGRTVSDEQLIDLAWEQSPPATVRAQLQSTIAGLRKQLGADTIERVADGYRIRVATGVLDLDEFDDRCLRARKLIDDPHRRADEMRAALDLWHGPALGGATDTLVRTEGAALEERRLAAVEDRIDADLAAGRYTDLVAELAGRTARHPLRERLHVQHMLALHRVGRTADALEVYRDARRRLVDELGLEPGPELRACHEAILREGAPAPTPPAVGGRPPAAAGAHPTTAESPAAPAGVDCRTEPAACPRWAAIRLLRRNPVAAAAGVVLGVLVGVLVGAGTMALAGAADRPGRATVPPPPGPTVATTPFLARWNKASGTAGTDFVTERYVRTKSDPGDITVDLLSSPAGTVCLRIVRADGYPLSDAVCASTDVPTRIATGLPAETRFSIQARSDKPGPFQYYLYY